MVGVTAVVASFNVSGAFPHDSLITWLDCQEWTNPDFYVIGLQELVELKVCQRFDILGGSNCQR
jgi:hypothetical protein